MFSLSPKKSPTYSFLPYYWPFSCLLNQLQCLISIQCTQIFHNREQHNQSQKKKEEKKEREKKERRGRELTGRAAGIAQVGKYSPYMCEDLSSIPRTHMTIPMCSGMYCIPALGRQRQEAPWGSLASQSSLIGELHTNETLCLSVGRQHSEHDTQDYRMISTHKCIRVHQHT